MFTPVLTRSASASAYWQLSNFVLLHHLLPSTPQHILNRQRQWQRPRHLLTTVSRNKPTSELPEQVSAAQSIPWPRQRKEPVELLSTVGARTPFKMRAAACSLMKRRDDIKQVDGV